MKRAIWEVLKAAIGEPTSRPPHRSTAPRRRVKPPEQPERELPALCAAVQRVRSALGLNPAAFAQLVGCAENSVYSWEMGRRVPASAGFLMRLSYQATEAGMPNEAALFAEAIGPSRLAVDEPRLFSRAVATVLRALRRRAGVSQEIAAASAGVTRNHLCHLESGHHNPNLYLFVKLADYYGMEWSEMLARVYSEFHRAPIVIPKKRGRPRKYPLSA